MNFLGNKQDVKTMLEAYGRWQNLCKSIVSLKRKGLNDQALRIMQEQLPQTIQQLESAIQFIADFANTWVFIKIQHIEIVFPMRVSRQTSPACIRCPRLKAGLLDLPGMISVMSWAMVIPQSSLTGTLLKKGCFMCCCFFIVRYFPNQHVV